MALAVSCLSEGLLLVDGDRVEWIDEVPTAGLAVGPLGAARALHEPSETALAGEVAFEGGRRLPIEGLRDAHDLAWDGGLLACVSTLANAILWIDGDGRVVGRWAAPGEGDCWHLSGLTVARGCSFVTAFGCFARHRDWAEADRDRSGFVLEVPSGRVVVGGLSSPHSPRIVDGRLGYCESGRGEVVVGHRRVRLGGWTRGLASVGEELVAGVSARRGTAGCARLVRLRRQDLAPLGHLELPVREVFDIVALPPERARALAITTGEPATMPALPPWELWTRLEAPPALTLAPGALAEVACTVTSLGSRPLVTARPFPVYVVSRWTPAGRSLWSSLAGTIEPGVSTTLPARLLAPERPGRYGLELRLVQEGVAWLDGGVEIEVRVA